MWHLFIKVHLCGCQKAYSYVAIILGLNAIFDAERLLNVKDSRIRCTTGNISKTVQDRHIITTYY